MAILAHYFTSLLFLGFLYTSINGNSIQSPNAACPSFDCGNGITIRYPFWHQSLQFEHCGYPGFNLSCKDQKPTLCLSSDLYNIKQIDYSNKSLILVYTKTKETSCPKIPHDVTLGTTPSLFNYTNDNKMLRFFYNCTLYPPSLPYIGCLIYGVKERSYVFMEGAIPEFDWHRFCESTVTVPVIDRAVVGDLVQSFGEALQDGFKLTWQQQDVACQSCEDNGGFCGYSNRTHRNFFCICGDGRHSINCYDTGSVSVGFEPNYVATGALIFGGLLIAATIFYFIQKKKLGSYKPV